MDLTNLTEKQKDTLIDNYQDTLANIAVELAMAGIVGAHQLHIINTWYQAFYVFPGAKAKEKRTGKRYKYDDYGDWYNQKYDTIFGKK